MIRPALEADIPRISEIHIYGWRLAYAGLISDDILYRHRTVDKQIESHRSVLPYWQDALVLDDNGIVKGFSFAGPSRSEDKKDAWELYAIYIEPAFKHQGVGTALVRRTEELAREKAKTELILWVLEKNTDGMRFYTKLGFTSDGGKVFDEDLKLNEIRMTKRL